MVHLKAYGKDTCSDKRVRLAPLEMRMYYVYVIKSKKDGKWYTGCTSDLRKRFKLHTSGHVAITKSRGPFTPIYYEASRDKEDAFAREKFLKSGPGKRYLKNRLKRFLSLTG